MAPPRNNQGVWGPPQGYPYSFNPRSVPSHYNPPAMPNVTQGTHYGSLLSELYDNPRDYDAFQLSMLQYNQLQREWFNNGNGQTF